jgi:hypothetical protein
MAEGERVALLAGFVAAGHAGTGSVLVPKA